MRVATDIGGTFTDMVSFEQASAKGEAGRVVTLKTDTTPGNFEEGIMNALQKAAINMGEVTFFVHGTTVVINAITERKGAKTALITTHGFKDVLEIARCNRPDMFNFNFVKQSPFVPRLLRREVQERIDYRGEIVKPIDLSSLPSTIEDLRQEGVEAIAVCLLHAYKNPQHEIDILQKIKTIWPEAEVICSYHITREWREYERTSSVVLSAYVLPTTKKYLHNLENKLRDKGLRNTPYIMQSNGGITTVEDVRRNPISIVESGPASGVFGAIALGKRIGKKNLIVLDIGGTTAKCALIEDGEVKISTQYKIEHSRTEAGYPIQTPIIDIVEIGNGGGSIAWVDKGGKMHVGPQSAGALPGPAAYGRGGKALTTTDANILMGKIHPDYFLNGDQQPDHTAIDKAAKEIGSILKMGKEDIAKGIIRIANANMNNALKLISVNKGYDPRDFSLVTIGGGGGMHGADLARELNIAEVIVPAQAGVFSALGMLMSDLRRDYIRTDVTLLERESGEKLEQIFSEMKQDAITSYQKDSYKPEQVKFTYYADLRYTGQEHYVKVKLPNPSQIQSLNLIIDAFHHAHKKQYTFTLDTGIELVNFHLVAEIEVDKPDFPKAKITGKKVEEALFDTRTVDFDNLGSLQTRFYDRDRLEPNMNIKGPAIIAEKSTTTVVPPQHQLAIDSYGNLVITPNP